MKFIKERFNNRGFTIIQALVSISILSAGTMALTHLSAEMNKVKLRADAHRTAAKFRNLLVDTISTSNSWEATVSNPDNTNLDCLKRTVDNPQGTDCRGARGTFTIYNGNEIMIYDPSDIAVKNNGFNLSGMFCREYSTDPNNGNTNCPFRYEVEWEPNCPPLPETCLDPEVRVIGKLAFNPSNSFGYKNLNVGRYNFDFVRDIAINTLKTSCSSLGGMLDQNTGNCTLPIQQSCSNLHGPGWVMVGIESRGNLRNSIVCKPFVKLCAAGTIMVGIQTGSHNALTPAWAYLFPRRHHRPHQFPPTHPLFFLGLMAVEMAMVVVTAAAETGNAENNTLL